jgi:hypothetical protein
MFYTHLAVWIAKPTDPADSVAPDPWAWSLDTIISLVGVLATIAIAVVAGVYAVSMTNRQAREDQRQRRVRLASAIDRYIEARTQGIATDESKAMHDTAVAEGFDFHAPEIEWVERYAEDVMWLYRDMPKGPEGAPLDQTWWLTYLRRLGDIRRRLFEWVASGRFDLTPLEPLRRGDDGRPVL